ncbi:MAG: hypothetical protein M0D53_14230 [Flavobacterium sp. JAD_PAG50586_2]|nr:MAG: hypothetical protein M0D53_14230 [Flavobacterium sp. JAD_PAG50586_2]
MKYFLILLILVTNKSFTQNIIFKPIGNEQQKRDSVKVNPAAEKKIIFRDSLAKEPLYILDGKPISYTEVMALNPETIESMTILKDSAANYFCNRSHNGVIIIKTKKFSKRELRKMNKKE